jgi:hypothetical protein
MGVASRQMLLDATDDETEDTDFFCAKSRFE